MGSAGGDALIGVRWLFVLITIGCAIWAGRQLHFPGGRRFAFRAEHTVEREQTRAPDRGPAEVAGGGKEALADSGARDAAHLRVAETASLHPNDHLRETARATLDAARKRRQSLTGQLRP